MKYTWEVETAFEADVVVIGGGPAGIAAAVSAARAGCSVALVEKYGFLGGMATAGLVAPFMKTYTVDGSTQIIKGIFEELICRMEAQNGAIHPSRIRTGTPLTGFLTFGHDHDTPFDPEVLKRVADEMLAQCRVRVFFHAQFVDAICSGDNLEKIVIADKSGLRAIGGKRFIDCSGDADVAAKCAVNFTVGDGNGTLQPATTMFRVCNVETEKTRRYVEEHPEDFMFIQLASKAHEAGDFPINRRRAIIFETVNPGIWVVNSTRVQSFDGSDPDKRSLAEPEGRRQVYIAFQYLKKYVPGFANAILMDSGAEIGARETRHIEGEYLLTESDIMTGKHFDDCIALSGFPMDIHDNSGKKDQFIQPENVNFYEVPYRCMVPKGKDNLLVAGRPVCATHHAAAAIRVMPTCFAMGQAAGIAASLAIRNTVPFRDVDAEALREQLRQAGACVDAPET